MPYTKERKLEEVHGDLSRVIPALVNECGQLGAAHRLGISQATVSRWLHRNGYRLVMKWEKEEKA